MKIAIGIMLWNEEGSIAMTIDSIFQQTLFTETKQGVDSVEVVALANGCTDASIPNARAAFERNIADCRAPYVTARVEELPKGRSPAWNKYVHELTDPETDYIFFMDADIIISHPNTMWSMVDGLEKSPYHPVAGALGIKDVELKPRKTLREKLSSAMTRMEHDARHFYMCGGLYCGRTSFLRQLIFPKGFICGDDGFLAYMAVTNLQTTPHQFDRILHPPDASFIFEAYQSIPKLFRQHKRRKVGAAVRGFIGSYVQSQQKDGFPDAGTIIRRACKANPTWLEDYSRERIAAAGFWVLPPRAIFQRMTHLRRLSWRSKLLKLPLAIAGTAWQAAVVLAANRALSTGNYSNVWVSLPNTRLTSRSVVYSSTGMSEPERTIQ